jgi:hypothetical protein
MSDTDERYTPQSVLDVVRAVAPIGLDPCTISTNPTRAPYFFTEKQDGLVAAWPLYKPGAGLVYVNPPYSRGQLVRWARKVVEYAVQEHAEVIVLTPCDLSTIWSTLLFRHAQAMAGWRSRIAFVTPSQDYDQGAKQPSLFWYFGERASRFKRVFDAHSNCVLLRGS